MKASLSLVAALAAAFEFSQAVPVSESEVHAALRQRSPSLVDCLDAKHVPISLASSSGFTQLAQTFNLRLQYTPAAIALPTTEQHVSDAVVCALNAGIKVQARSGGHSYASYSAGGQDGSLIINLENFQNITVDQTTNVAQVAGGVRLGNMALALMKYGRALPHGTCPG